MACLVESLESDAAGGGSIADHGDHMILLSLDGFCRADPEARGNRGAAVPCVEGVVGAFAPFREPADSPVGAKRVKTIPPSGQQLVGVRLVAHIPDDLVSGRIENIMKGDRQFHHTQVRGQVPPGSRHGFNDLAAHLGGQSAHIVERQLFEVRRAVDLAQKGVFLWGSLVIFFFQ